VYIYRAHGICISLLGHNEKEKSDFTCFVPQNRGHKMCVCVYTTIECLFAVLMFTFVDTLRLTS